MANSWCRLWHDMPNDPKWRTIARVSGQPIGDVLAVWIHIMVDASANANERGRTQGAEDEDIASALDLQPADVAAIRAAMQGRVLDGDRLTGWDKRQPKREDDSAERSKAWREEKKRNANEPECEQTQPNASERKRTLDKDTDKERTITPKGDLLVGVAPQIAADFKALRTRLRAPITQTAMDGIRREATLAGLGLDAALAMCCERSWRGFKAEWVEGTARGAAPATGPKRREL